MLYAVAGDIGYIIELDVGTQADGTAYDWTGATGRFRALLEDGTRPDPWVATLSGRTMSYSTEDGDLVEGLTVLDADVTFGDGRRLTYQRAIAITVRRRT